MFSKILFACVFCLALIGSNASSQQFQFGIIGDGWIMSNVNGTPYYGHTYDYHTEFTCSYAIQNLGYPSNAGVSVLVVEPGYTDWFSLEFSSGTSQALQAGVYYPATRWPFNAPGTPGLSVFASGSGCNQLTGGFYVSEIAYDPNSGAVTNLAIDGLQYCENNPLNDVYFMVRFNSSQPIIANQYVQ